MNLQSEIAYALDPAKIMVTAGMQPDHWQASILRKRARNVLLNCSRQSGKTSTVATMAVDEMLRGPALVLAICPSERQSKELVRTTSQIFRSIESLPQQQSTTCLQCRNGARMFALPSSEANIRGFSKAALLLIDEASRIPDELYHAVRPMLAVSGGRLVALSTPFGKRGFFHEAWTQGEGWARVKVTATECPRISAEFLEQERRSMPAAWFRQEYFCEFSETEGAVFAYADVMAALSADVEPLFGPAEGVTVTSSEVEPLFDDVRAM